MTAYASRRRLLPAGDAHRTHRSRPARPRRARRVAPLAGLGVLRRWRTAPPGSRWRCWPASSSRWSSVPCRRSSKYGLSFLWPTEWDPVQEKFGGLVMIYGTLMTSVIALLIAVPVSFGIALFLTELSPAWLKRPLGHRDRAAGGRAVDRLRHVGPVGVRPVPRRVRAAAAAVGVRRRAVPRPAVPGPAGRASACCRPASSWRSW